MSALFKIRFADGDVHPDTVPVHELAELLIATEQALTSVVAQENPDVDTSELIVGLVNVKDESLGLEFATSYPALFERAFERVTVAVSSRRFDELPSRAIVGIQTIAGRKQPVVLETLQERFRLLISTRWQRHSQPSSGRIESKL